MEYYLFDFQQRQNCEAERDSTFVHWFWSTTFSISYKGKTVKLKETQLDAKFIGKLFNVYPDSVLLLSDDGTVEGPDENGRFRLEDYLEYELQGEVMDSAKIVTTMASCSSVKKNSQ